MEFSIEGEMPSGMNEENALQYVMKKAFTLTSVEVNGDDDEDDQGRIVYN